MYSYQFTFTINGLSNVVANPEDRLKVDYVNFYTDGKYKYAQITVDAKDLTGAEVRAKDLVSRSLSKIIFAYNTGASINYDGCTYIDLDHDPPMAGGINGILTVFSVGMPDPKLVLSKISQIKPEKKDVLDLALAYYRLCYYDNPIRLLTLFSSLNVLARYLLNMKVNDHLKTDDLN
jgi:hypothetical protein